MRAAPPLPSGSGILWTLSTQLDAPLSQLDHRARACREVWDSVARRARDLGIDAPGATVVRTPRGSLVMVAAGHRLAGALVARGAVVSVVAYELRERLGSPA